MPLDHDPVHHPAHYTSGARECIDMIRDALGDDGFVAFCRGNAMKYHHRAGLKGAATEDMSKAVWYERMAAHVRAPDVMADPRADRADFVPYVRR